MRFAAVTVKTRPAEPTRAPAMDLLRRLITPDTAARLAAAAKPQEPPCDLDQRVRLIGEW